ncbi:MAG: geranylgeranyl reductase family protein [Actinomycetaceae bacterium]|nr:geranylgeranyl reductase family protein [Actinomycetaceae bacterium]MDY6082684.1 geranylgeranyl reductase family protein [Actinomycetaceae bacterium]
MAENRQGRRVDSADVIVVGAGPAGSSVAYWAAKNGLDVLVLEKAHFPRDKVCGDGLTPRAVAELQRMGVNFDGWARNWALRTYGGGHRIEIPWPSVDSLPNFGLTCPRIKLDEVLIRHAQKAGARLREGVTVTGPVVDPIRSMMRGVSAQMDGETVQFHARYVVDAGGVAARLATKLGREKNPQRPVGVAYRTYFRSPRSHDQVMESHLEMWDGVPHHSSLIPGYGWVFAEQDGLVNVGLGSLSATAKPSGVDYRTMFNVWMRNVPPEWGFTPENQVGTLRGAALPMAFNRKPHYGQGLLLVGDAGGMVSPFNGEGIAYALQSGRYAAQALVDALAAPNRQRAEDALCGYSTRLRQELGGYYTLGRVFASLISRPEIMHVCVQYGLPHPVLMRLVMKLLSDSYDRSGGDWMDRLISTLTHLAPKA